MTDDAHKEFNQARCAFVKRVRTFARDTGNWLAFGLAHTLVYERMDSGTRTTVASQKQLAADMGIAERTVRRLLSELKALGLLVNQGNGRGNAGHYSIGQPKIVKAVTSDLLSGRKADSGDPLSGAERRTSGAQKAESGVRPSKENLQVEESCPGGQVARAREGRFSEAKESGGRGLRIPEIWTPTEDDRAFAVSRGLTPTEIDFQAEKFRSHYAAVSGDKGLAVNWGARFRKWVLTEIERRGAFLKPNAAALQFTLGQWALRLQMHAEKGGDWPSDWGPPPGAPGSLVPPELHAKPILMPARAG